MGDHADVIEALINKEIEGVLIAGIVAPGIINELQCTNEAVVTIWW